jgi:hypothetical protein
MLLQSSVAIREMGEMGAASPAPWETGPPTLKLPFGVSFTESSFGGDCRPGFSVLRRAAGT